MEAISTQMQGPKSLAFSFGDFDFMTMNHVAATHSKAKGVRGLLSNHGFSCSESIGLRSCP